MKNEQLLHAGEKTRITAENAAQMQKRSAEARVRNRLLSEILREELHRKVDGVSKLERMIANAIDNAMTSPSLKDLQTIQGILGEQTATLTANISQMDGGGMTRDEYVETLKAARIEADEELKQMKAQRMK